MSDESNETAVDAASAFVNADVFYDEESAPSEPTEAGEIPEVEEEEVEETDESEAKTESEDDQEVESKRYSFDDESGEYTFKAGGKDVSANTDKLIELASKGVGLEKKNAQTKRNEQQRAKEHTEALESVKTRENELQGLIDGLESLLDEDKVDDELLDVDPSEYIRQEKRINERKQKIEAAKNALQLKRQGEQNAVASRELAKLKDVMGWDSQEKVTDGFNEISDYCLEIGMNGDEVKGITNHKIYLAFSEAAKYRELQAKKASTVKEVKSAPKSVKSKTTSKPKTEKSAVEVLYG